MRKLKVLVGATGLLFATASNSAIIDMGDYQYDDQTNLEWLDLSLTDGISLAQAQTSYSGWTLATESQFRTMFEWYNGVGGGDTSVLGFNDGTYSNDPLGVEKLENSSSGQSYLGNSFSSDFGLTRYFNSIDFETALSYGFYSDDNLNGMYLGGVAATNYFSNNTDSIRAYYDYFNNYNPSNSTTYTNDAIGLFLVRESTSVSEPSILALMGAGLVGLGFARRRARK